MRNFFIIVLLFSITGINFAQASQAEINKMENELNLFKIDLDKIEKHRSKLDLQKENMLDIIQMQYKNLSDYLLLAKKDNKDITDQNIRSMRLILQQQHNLTKQLFGGYL